VDDAVAFDGFNEMDPPLCGAAVINHNEVWEEAREADCSVRSHRALSIMPHMLRHTPLLA
jgi:ssRNA-specific RNase YbeY (16S rRNA maturation enzyme)